MTKPAPMMSAGKAAGQLQSLEAGGAQEKKESQKKDELTVLRGYAYQHVPGLERDTLLWQPALFLAAGSTQVAFDAPTTPGTYRVLLIGHTADGRLGFYEGYLEVQPDPSR
jgi:hypothetical protein